MKKTVLVTTNWGSRTDDELYIEREKELQANHWRSIIQEGAEVRRFLQTRESAWEIINVLLRSADLKVPLLLPKQLVDHQMPFLKTEAGRHATSIAKTKKDGKKEQKRTMDRLGCMIQ